MKRLLIIAALAALVAAYFFFGLGDYLTVEGIKQVRGSSDVQVKDVEVALVSGYGDFGDGSLAVFTKK